MSRRRQYKRNLKLVYGDQAQELGIGPTTPFTLNCFAGRGLRTTFQVSRNNRGEPDTATIDIYNLPKQYRDNILADVQDQWRLRAEVQRIISVDGDARRTTAAAQERARRLKQLADAYRVNLFVGYGPEDRDLTLLFRGDLLDVTPVVRRGGIDTITRLKLGDTLLALRDSYMRQVFGTGSTLANIIEGTAAAAALELDAGAKALIRIVGPNAVASKINNGWVAAGRVGDTLTELIDQFGLQWWVRDGVLYFGPQGSTLNDFALQFQDGVDLLDVVEQGNYGDVRAKVLLNPDAVPGRGIVLRTKEGELFSEFGYRVDRVDFRGDTHGTPWWADFVGAGVDSRLLAPTAEFESREFTSEALLDELERVRG